MNKRVCVTGIGVVSSIGIGQEEFWKNLIAGKSGVTDVTTFDTSEFENHKGGEVKDFIPGDFIDDDAIMHMGRASQFAVAAAKLALKDAGLNVGNLKKEKVAVIVGTTMGEGGMIEQIDKCWTAWGEEDVWGLTVSKYPSNSISNNVNRSLGIGGVSCVIPTACAAGNYSIGYGYDLIKSGRLNKAIVGGADPFSRIGFTGFGRLYAMSPDKCRPFDKNRKGMIVGEGAGILIIEELNAAINRGATIYAEIMGYGLSCDATHMTAPQVEGISKVMKKALLNSQIDKKDIGYICAHGTGTPANDKAEVTAIKEIFSDSYAALSVSSIKSMLGHTMGAASAIEATACCLAVKHGILPPTINYEEKDPECDIDCVPNVAKNRDVKIVLNNSLAFGGNNCCLAFQRWGGISGNDGL
jgi:3-oxoacyl-[acyl-carrier-protein] synthase II